MIAFRFCKEKRQLNKIKQKTRWIKPYRQWEGKPLELITVTDQVVWMFEKEQQIVILIGVWWELCSQLLSAPRSIDRSLQRKLGHKSMKLNAEIIDCFDCWQVIRWPPFVRSPKHGLLGIDHHWWQFCNQGKKKWIPHSIISKSTEPHSSSHLLLWGAHTY